MPAAAESADGPMIVFHGTFRIEPDRMDEALEHAERLVRETNEEPGVVDYRIARDVVDDHTLRFFEQYEDEAAVDHHTETPHVRAFSEALPDLLAAEPTLTQFEVADVSERDLGGA